MSLINHQILLASRPAGEPTTDNFKLVETPVGFTIIYTAVSEASWNKMNPATKDFFTKEMAAFGDRGWKIIGDEVEMGLICVSGQGGTCSEGKPGKVVRVTPSEADVKAREAALNDVVLKRWAKRCGVSDAGFPWAYRSVSGPPMARHAAHPLAGLA